MLRQLAATAAFVASVAYAEKLARGDLFINVVNCTNIPDEDEPYVYYEIDTSVFSKAIVRQTGLGVKQSGDDNKNVYTFPKSLQIWEKLETPSLQTVETYIYGYDRLNRDDKLGKLDYKLDKVPNNCQSRAATLVLDKDNDTKCTFQVAICPVGSKPKELQTKNTPAPTTTFKPDGTTS